MNGNRGFGWERREDGEIAYRTSRWSPTYSVSDDQLRSLNATKRLEVIVSVVSCMPLAAVYFAWLLGDYVSWKLLLCVAVLYAVPNHLFWMHMQKRRKRILVDASLASVPLEFPPMPWRRK